MLLAGVTARVSVLLAGVTARVSVLLAGVTARVSSSEECFQNRETGRRNIPFVRSSLCPLCGFRGNVLRHNLERELGWLITTKRDVGGVC